MTLDTLSHAARLLDSLGQHDLSQAVTEAATLLGRQMRQCLGCKEPIPAHGPAKRCPACAKKEVQRYQREYYKTKCDNARYKARQGAA